jgi:hypothetical protein
LDWGQKPAHDLGLEDQFGDDRVFKIGSATLGAARDLFDLGSLKLMLGGQGIFYSVPDALEPVYGTSPISFEVFLRLSPKRMMGSGTPESEDHEMHGM